MSTTVSPIVTTTALSVLLHGAVVAVLLVATNKVVVPDQAVGKGLSIELVSSEMIDNHLETDIPKKQRDVQPVKVIKRVEPISKQKNNLQLLSSLNKSSVIVAKNDDVNAFVKQQKQNNIDSNSLTTVMLSTDAAAQQHSILELLHSRISSNKEYPYLARRQRREGKTTVAFVLYPDGRIENTRMVHSSQVVTLDRAAISAVNSIQPFEIAQDYLQKAKEFHVDVVFNLL